VKTSNLTTHTNFTGTLILNPFVPELNARSEMQKTRIQTGGTRAFIIM